MADAGVEDVTSHFVTSDDDLRLHVLDYGTQRPNAPVAICLPGLTRNGRDFERLAIRLRSRARIVCPDFRGRGRSDPSPDPERYVPVRYVADLGAVMDQLGIARACLIGTSLGGLVATLFAAAHPDRVTGVVLNDVGPEIDPAGLARIASYVGKVPPIASWQDAANAVALLDAAVYPDFKPADWQRLARQRYVERDGAIRLDYDLDIAKAFALPETTPDSWPAFRALRTIPTLLLHGACSDILAPATVAGMQAALPALAVVEIADRGHVPTLDEPAAVAAIEGFLDQVQETDR